MKTSLAILIFVLTTTVGCGEKKSFLDAHSDFVKYRDGEYENAVIGILQPHTPSNKSRTIEAGIEHIVKLQAFLAADMHISKESIIELERACAQCNLLWDNLELAAKRESRMADLPEKPTMDHHEIINRRKGLVREEIELAKESASVFSPEAKLLIGQGILDAKIIIEKTKLREMNELNSIEKRVFPILAKTNVAFKVYSEDKNRINAEKYLAISKELSPQVNAIIKELRDFKEKSRSYYEPGTGPSKLLDNLEKISLQEKECNQWTEVP